MEGPPPGVESGDDSKQEESSSDEGEEVLTDESEDSNQSDMVRTGKECRVDLPSLRVERGSCGCSSPGRGSVTFSQYCGFYMSFQATQAICIMMQVEGKLTKEKVTRMLREKKLSEPAEIRFKLQCCSESFI